MSQQSYTVEHLEQLILEYPGNFTYRRLYADITGQDYSFTPRVTSVHNLDVWREWGRDCMWHLEGHCTLDQGFCPDEKHWQNKLERITREVKAIEEKRFQNAPT